MICHSYVNLPEAEKTKWDEPPINFKQNPTPIFEPSNRNWDIYDQLLERQSGGALTTGETAYRWSLGCVSSRIGTDAMVGDAVGVIVTPW